MSQSRVFVVQEPTKLVDGQHVRKMDLSPALEHGELVFLLPPGEPPLDPLATVPYLKLLLADFTPADALLLVGHPVLIGWAAAIAAQKTRGRLALLHWQSQLRRYSRVEAPLF